MRARVDLDNHTVLLVVCLWIGAATTLVHVKAVDLPNRSFQTEWHRAVIECRAPAPDQHRMLTFLVAEGIRRATGADLIWIYAALRAVLTTAALAVIYRYLRFWLTPSVSMAGLLGLGASLPITFFGYRMQVTDPANLLFFALAFRALQIDAPGRIYLILPLAVANRETAVFLIPFCVAAWWGRITMRSLAARTAGLTILSLLVLASMHSLPGNHPPYAPLFTLLHNLGSPQALVFPMLLFGWFWIAAFASLDGKPSFLRRMVVPAIAFVALHLLVARLAEARLLLPLAPVILPLALFSIGGRAG